MIDLQLAKRHIASAEMNRPSSKWRHILEAIELAKLSKGTIKCVAIHLQLLHQPSRVNVDRFFSSVTYGLFYRSQHSALDVGGFREQIKQRRQLAVPRD